MSSAAPVGPATDRAPGASFRTPETRSLVARRTSRSTKPLARSISRARSSETTLPSRDPPVSHLSGPPSPSPPTPAPPPRPPVPPVPPPVPSSRIRSTSASRARSHRSLASASARSPRCVRLPVTLSVSTNAHGYTRSTYTTADAHAPPSGLSVRSGMATRRFTDPSLASHLAGLTPLKCNARWRSFAFFERGGTGSSEPRSSAPCTSTLAPTCSPGWPARRSEVRPASSTASMPYQPSVSSRRARPSGPAPNRLIATTHSTAGDLAGVSRSNTRRTHGRCALKISRSYRYSIRSITAGAFTASAASGNARATHDCVHTVHLYALAHQSGSKSLSTHPCSEIMTARTSSESSTRSFASSRTRYPTAVSAFIARTCGSRTTLGAPGRSPGLR